MKKNISGFTLVELLIALTVVAILATLAIVFFGSQLAKGRDAKRKSDLDQIKNAIEEYEKDHNCYPTYVSCGVITDQPIYYYLNNVPCDPVTNASYIYENDGNPVCPGWYRVYAKLENTQDIQALPWCGGAGNNSFNYYVSSPNAPSCAAVAGGPTASGGGPVGGGGPTASPGVNFGQFYACQGGVCLPTQWDYSRPGPYCEPNFSSSSCSGRCGPALNECTPWNQKK